MVRVDDRAAGNLEELARLGGPPAFGAVVVPSWKTVGEAFGGVFGDSVALEKSCVRLRERGQDEAERCKSRNRKGTADAGKRTSERRLSNRRAPNAAILRYLAA